MPRTATRLTTRIALAGALAGALVGTAGCSLGDGREQDIASVDVDVVDAPAGAAAFTGRLRLFAETEVSADGQRWFSLSIIAPPLFSVPLQRADSAQSLHVGGFVPAGSYTMARLVVYEATHARVSGTIGGQTAANDSIAVAIGTTPLLIQREFSPVALGDGDALRLTWDFNTEVWITPAAFTARRATAASLASAVTLSVSAPTR